MRREELGIGVELGVTQGRDAEVEFKEDPRARIPQRGVGRAAQGGKGGKAEAPSCSANTQGKMQEGRGDRTGHPELLRGHLGLGTFRGFQGREFTLGAQQHFGFVSGRTGMLQHPR